MFSTADIEISNKLITCTFYILQQERGHDVPHSKKQTQSTPQPTPARNSAGSRSGTLKRVAFKDEQTVHDDGASSVRFVMGQN